MEEQKVSKTDLDFSKSDVGRPQLSCNDVSENQRGMGTEEASLIESFPMESMRPQQSLALEKIAQSYEQGKKNCILELPTGSGKSPISISVSRWASQLPETDFRPGAYILSTQNTLVHQMMQDFGKDGGHPAGLVDLKGKSNYRCETWKTDCSIGSKLGKESKCEFCPYREAKNEFCRRTFGVTNFAYFLSETRYGGQLKPRKFLIIDECHNVEREILNFADIEITQARADTCNAGQIPYLKLKDKQDWSMGFNTAAKEWLEQTFIPASDKYLTNLELEREQYQFDNDHERAGKTAKKQSAWENFAAKVKQFVITRSPGDWISFSDRQGNLIIRPLAATLFADEILFSRAEHVLMMSATILDPRTFSRNLGLDPKDCSYLSLPSDFPAANRPIYYKPQGSMSWTNKADTLPRMIRFIEKI